MSSLPTVIGIPVNAYAGHFLLVNPKFDVRPYEGQNTFHVNRHINEPSIIQFYFLLELWLISMNQTKLIELVMAQNDVNVIAAQGFQQAATVYEQARPSYSNEVVNLIKSLYDKPDIIVDLGAGTGKLTRLLGPLGAREIIAIEPVLSMREKLINIPIITKILDGTAEHLPFDDNTIDIIVCGQSFHWFANHRALAELNRVLKSNGLLVLVWNLTDNIDNEWAEHITKYVDSFQPANSPRYKTMEWRQAFDNQNLFSSLQQKQFDHKQRVTRDLLVDRILSTSFIAVLPSPEQKKLIDEVRRMLENVEEIRNRQEFDLCHRTNVYWCSPLK